MVDRTKDKPSTSQNTPLKLESNSSPFIDTVRSILERDRNTSPFTPEQSTQILEESRRILTRVYAHQLGLTLIYYSLPIQQQHDLQLTTIDQDSIEDDTSQLRTPSHQVKSLHRETTRTNTIRIFTSVGGFGEPPFPPESPPDSPRSFNQEVYSDSEEYTMARNILAGGGGGGNPPNPPSPQLPWLRIATVGVPGVQHPLPKNLDKLLPKFNPDNKELVEVHVDKFILVVQTMNVQHEDIVCRLFPLTFEGKASTW